MPPSLRPARADDTPFLAEMLAAAACWRPDGPHASVTEVMGRPDLSHYLTGWPR